MHDLDAQPEPGDLDSDRGRVGSMTGEDDLTSPEFHAAGTQPGVQQRIDRWSAESELTSYLQHRAVLIDERIDMLDQLGELLLQFPTDPTGNHDQRDSGVPALIDRRKNLPRQHAMSG